ncbi:DUF2178 domain-containing protein [Thermococcus piezophilus]|uniref:Uncharacterized protein n=1 Tax=Thermococcus piezophilus TaxID=1712654 RepID=A0A172WFF5_9EURY|nr:DUF2178 domain-containing protein [Thermococcus piezophilus]ANF22164.1 hypothetical protein A7C91_02395 [Thermococcus piezophilus]
MNWGAVVGLILGLAVATYLPVIYRRNIGLEMDERVARIEEKASKVTLELVQLVSGLGIAYSAFVAKNLSTAFTFLLLVFMASTFGHLAFKVHYSRVM